MLNKFKKFILKSIEKLIVLAFLGSMIVAGMGYLAWENHNTFEKTIVSQTQQQLLSTAKSIALSIENFFTMQQEILKSLASDPILSQLTPDMDFSQLEMRYKELKGDISGFYLISSKGIVTHRYPHKDRVGMNFANKPGISTALRTRKSHISKLFTSNSGKPCISVLEPIILNGKFIGLVRALTYIKTIQNIYIKPIKIGKKGFTKVIDKKGVVIMHSQSKHLGEHIITLREEKLPQNIETALKNLVEKMTDGKEGVDIYQSAWWVQKKWETEKKLIAYAPVHIGDELWSISTSIDYSEIAAPIKAHSKNTFSLVGFMILLISTGGFILHNVQRKKILSEEKAKQFEAISKSSSALEKSEKKYRFLAESMKDVIVQISPEAQLLYVSPSIKKFGGYDTENDTGNHIAEYFESESDLIRALELLEKVLKTHQSGNFEFLFKAKNQKPFPVELTYFPIIKDNTVIRIQFVLRDITERKQTEKAKIKLENQLQQAQKMEAIGTLAGGVAHDLNNVLSAVVAYPDLILMDLPDNSPLKKPIISIQESGFKAAAIVQDLLTLARRGVVVADVMNLNQIVDNYINSPEHAKLKSFYPNAVVKSNLDADVLNIMGSAVHLFKTIMNLVNNAAEAMPDGGEITISTQNQYIDKPVNGYNTINEGDYAVLKISDTGTGIASKDIKRIFEPFYTKKVMGRSGTGLGMAVVWGTVKDHHGYIDVQSILNKGTTFKLYFPVTREEAGEQKTALPRKKYIGKRESILIVDDIKAQRNVATDLLKKLNYVVTSVESGEQAVDYMKQNSADLVILDMIMDPGIDGCETYKQILEFHPEQKAIITSGFSETDRVKEAQKLGAGEYVKKPYTFENIGLAVQKELRR